MSPETEPQAIASHSQPVQYNISLSKCKAFSHKTKIFSPLGSPKKAGTLGAPERGAAAAAAEGFAVGTHVFMKSQANSYPPPWLPDGGAGRPNGLTEGVWFVEW